MYYYFKKLHWNEFKQSHGDDFIAEGLLGLIKAAKTYDPARCKFATYATRCIQNQFFMYLRWLRNKEAPTIPLSVVINGHAPDGTELTLADTEIMVDWNSFEEIDKVMEKDYRDKLLDAFLKTRGGKDKEIIELMRRGHKQKAVAELVGISQSYVSRRFRNIQTAFAKYKARREKDVA